MSSACVNRCARMQHDGPVIVVQCVVGDLGDWHRRGRAPFFPSTIASCLPVAVREVRESVTTLRPPCLSAIAPFIITTHVVRRSGTRAMRCPIDELVVYGETVFLFSHLPPLV